MSFAVKAAVEDARAETFLFLQQKTMYGGKLISEGDEIFVFASETQGGSGLLARGVVTSAKPVAKRPDLLRQTPRVSIEVDRIALARNRLGRNEVRRFTDWKDGRAETEINFKLYRQATNKVVGITEHTALFLATFF